MDDIRKQIEEWRRLEEAATRGPWELHHEGGVWVVRTGPRKPVRDRHYVCSMSHGLDVGNRTFIAASREAVPALCAMVEAALDACDNAKYEAHWHDNASQSDVAGDACEYVRAAIERAGEGKP